MAEFPKLQTVVHAVSTAASISPRQTALVCEDCSLDYGSLLGRANQIARFLVIRGVNPEDKVGISLPRSIDFAVAALGILKARAAYVALDPAHPTSRRQMIEEDAALVLSLGLETRGAAPGSALETVSLQDPAILGQITDGTGLMEPDTNQVAYVVYTSGSTGVPKGVEVTHGNLAHLIQWHNQAFKIGSADRATLLANVAFDAAVWELWPYLSVGATLFLPGIERVRQPETLRNYIVENAITMAFAPTLLAEALIQLTWPAETRLRSLLTGGDTLRRWPPLGLPFSLINNYGPAECTVVSTSGEVKSSDLPSGLPSIGVPIQEVSISILDEELQEVPVGAPGEICIAGPGVTRGYLRQPKLTAQRFVTRRGGERTYRSGDLGALNEDGSIQFLGRMDNQVKIRGFRIECGEIEAALNNLSTVKTSAVVAREQVDGHLGLTAYLELVPGASSTHQSLRQNLRTIVPEYMIPEQFVRVNGLPETENGKIDRSQLPCPDASNLIAGDSQAMTPVETELSEILKKLLAVNHIALDDDFFLLGGHSFIAAQLIARVRDQFGIELGLRTVFENPTLVGMAKQIEEKVRLASCLVPNGSTEGD